MKGADFMRTKRIWIALLVAITAAQRVVFVVKGGVVYKNVAR
jgi:hypothetical protein